VLAAGGSTRMGAPKALLHDAAGRTLVTRAVRALADGGCNPVLVVAGEEAEAIGRALREQAPALPWRVLPHAGWRGGMGTSIAAGMTALLHDDALHAVAALVIAAVDMPAAGAPHVAALVAASDGGRRRVASAWREGAEDAEVIIGVPALLPRGDWPQLAQLTGETGARTLLREDGVISVFIREYHYDLDTPDALARWRAHNGNAPPE